MTNQAVILARGLGSRMRRAASDATLTDEQASAADSGAKGMMPFGRPFLDYVISALADAGIAHVVLVVAPEHGAMREHFERAFVPERVTVRFAVQDEPRGTADAVLACRGVVNDSPFLVLNSDNYYPVDAYRRLAAIDGSGMIAFEQEALVRESGIEPERVLRYALVETGTDGRLRSIREKPEANDPLAVRARRLVSMNLWSFTPVILEACEQVEPSKRGELELQDAVTIAMRQFGERFRVLAMSAGVLDLSNRADISFVASKLARITPHT